MVRGVFNFYLIERLNGDNFTGLIDEKFWLKKEIGMMFFHRKKKVINVTGMHCVECANRIKSTLLACVEITRVRVNLKRGEVVVFYDGLLDNEFIQRKIEGLGFGVTGMKELH